MEHLAPSVIELTTQKKDTGTDQIKSIKLQVHMNDKMERPNGEVRIEKIQ